MAKKVTEDKSKEKKTTESKKVNKPNKVKSEAKTAKEIKTVKAKTELKDTTKAKISKKKVNSSDNHSFKTAEVIVLVVLTCLISLTMGIFLHSRFGVTSDKYDQLIASEPQLESFIETYNDVVNNYYDEVDKEKLIDDAIEGMFSSLDINSNYLNQDTSDTFNKQLDGQYQGIGIEVVTDNDGNIIILSVFEDTPAEKAGLQVMDIIKSINGQSLEGKDSSELVNLIEKSKKKTLKIVVTRDDEDKEIKVKKDTVVLKSVSSKVIVEEEKNIGYLRISIFANNTAKQFKSNLSQLEKENIEALIIDVRDNSGGHLTSVVSILSQLLDDSHVIYQVQTKDKIKEFSSEGSKTKEYPIVVLMNEASASASEVLASALKEQIDATLIGEKTFGKGTIQELQSLTSGDSYKITTKKWLTSKGEWLNEKGLEPDIAVELNEDYYNNPSDETDNQLQTALQHLVN